MAKKTVLVGMSGGVDSSTVAAILQNEGYDVIGVTLQLYKTTEIGKSAKSCCGSQEIFDAKRAASDCGIKHYVIDYQEIFKKEVIDNFINEYENNRTPIPCIQCNRTVKFRDMIKLADEFGIEHISTGHYVRKVQNDNGFELHKGADSLKDQSYFLFTITQEQLKRSLFPLGGFTKSQTREISRKFNISTSEKRESQDICFIPNGNYGDFLTKYNPELKKTGNIIHQQTNEVVGTHNGAAFYTIGQRRGIGVGGVENPLYVSKIDVQNNVIFVSDEKDLYSDEFTITDINFINENFANIDSFECNVINRALKPEIPAKITKISNNQYQVKLSKPDRAITPGQACVMHIGTQVIGGGFVEKVLK